MRPSTSGSRCARRLRSGASDDTTTPCAVSLDPSVGGIRSPHGWIAWGCSECGATRSSCRQRFFTLPNDQVALFLHHLWATDGSVRWDAKLGQARIYYASTSRRLVDDVSALLLRMGVQARIKPCERLDTGRVGTSTSTAPRTRPRFLHLVDVNGDKWLAAESSAKLDSIAVNTNWTRCRKKCGLRFERY